MSVRTGRGVCRGIFANRLLLGTKNARRRARSWAEAKHTGPPSLTRALTTASSGANGQPDPPFSCALSSFSTPSLTRPRARVETATATRRAVSISGRSAFSCRQSARGRGRARPALRVRRDAQCVLARLAHPKARDSSARRRRLRPRLARVSPRPPSILAPAERREWVEIGQRRVANSSADDLRPSALPASSVSRPMLILPLRLIRSSPSS